MIDPVAAERFFAAHWLPELDRETKRAILESLVEEKSPKGAVLLAQGQPNDHLTFLIGGTVELERTFPNSHKERITTLNAPAVFGSTSFFQPKPPTASVRAISDVWMLTLYHPQHEALRASNPRAAEALALAVVRTLSERFDLLDALFTEFMAKNHSVPSPVSEWANFRARLFEEQTP